MALIFVLSSAENPVVTLLHSVTLSLCAQHTRCLCPYLPLEQINRSDGRPLLDINHLAQWSTAGITGTQCLSFLSPPLHRRKWMFKAWLSWNIRTQRTVSWLSFNLILFSELGFSLFCVLTAIYHGPQAVSWVWPSCLHSHVCWQSKEPHQCTVNAPLE